MSDARMFVYMVPMEEEEDRVKIRVEVVHAESGRKLESEWDCTAENYMRCASALQEAAKKLVREQCQWTIERIAIRDFVNFVYESGEIGDFHF